MTTYKITDEAKLKAAFAHFIKTKTKKVTTVAEVSVLDQKAVKYALKAGIEVPGIEKISE